MKTTIDIFVELGVRLRDGVPQEVVQRAYEECGWFSRCEVERAVEAIRTQMLSREELTRWAQCYSINPVQERVLIVMAGNIPLVGIFDLLCVLVAGDIALVKFSHKDRVLMSWIVETLREIEPSIPIYKYSDGDPFDRLIATGGESAARHFRERYADIPILIRGSRHSMAILSGEESDDELEGLLSDIYSYSGLGCRNVSMLLLLEDYDLKRLPVPRLESLNPKYVNNYLQNRALLTLAEEAFVDNGASLLLSQKSFPTRVSTLAIVRYTTREELLCWVEQYEEQIQCIVAREGMLAHPRRVGLGEAQCPTLFDYADGIDTMTFLMVNG